MRWRYLLPLGCLAFGATPAPAVSAEAHLRVVDVGPGLCVVATTPGGHAMLYDAGPPSGFCLKAVEALVAGPALDLVVLSHSDQDHVSELPDILVAKRPKIILHPGDNHGGAVIGPIRAKIRSAGAVELDLGDPLAAPARQPPTFGDSFKIGDATATFIAGWADGNRTRGQGEPALDESERNNALSLVIRFVYGGHSVLLTGDTVGRHLYDPNTACKNAERIMASHLAGWPIASDVLVGQHHGGDNATSNCFIQAVKPTYVVFSAGHAFHHPRQSTVDRLVANGVKPQNIFRTDRGDDEPTTDPKVRQWITGSIKGCADKPGDDDVEIVLPDDPAKPVTVAYRTASHGC